MTNLAKAIISVMKEVKGIEKNLQVGTGNSSYKGVADQEVKKIIGDAMAKHGLCILPIETNAQTRIDRWEEVDQYSKETPKPMKTKQSVFTEVETKYLLIHESGESQVISGYGHGVDSQDKSAGKATTYALKYALLYSFLVPTGKIDDADTEHSDSHEVPAKEDKRNWLNIWTDKSHQNFTKEGQNTLEKLRAGLITLDVVKQHYKLSKEVESFLIENSKP